MSFDHIANAMLAVAKQRTPYYVPVIEEYIAAGTPRNHINIFQSGNGSTEFSILILTNGADGIKLRTDYYDETHTTFVIYNEPNCRSMETFKDGVLTKFRYLIDDVDGMFYPTANTIVGYNFPENGAPIPVFAKDGDDVSFKVKFA